MQLIINSIISYLGCWMPENNQPMQLDDGARMSWNAYDLQTFPHQEPVYNLHHRTLFDKVARLEGTPRLRRGEIAMVVTGGCHVVSCVASRPWTHTIKNSLQDYNLPNKVYTHSSLLYTFLQSGKARRCDNVVGDIAVAATAGCRQDLVPTSGCFRVIGGDKPLSV